MKPTQLLRLFGIIFVCLILQGCWDVKDIDNRMLVAVLGIEQAEDDKISLWLRFPITKTTQTGGGGLDKNFFMTRQKADTVVDALDELRSRLPKSLDLSETRAIFLDQKLAERGVKPYLEFAVRDRTLPLSTVVSLVSGSMETIFTKPNPTGELSGIYTKLYFESYAGGTPQKNKVPMWSLFSRIYNPLEENIMPLLSRGSENMFELKGNAFFVGDKMVGMITPEETLIYEIVSKKMSDFEIETTEGANVKILKNNTMITSKMSAGKPVIHIHTLLTMTLMDSSQATQSNTTEIEESVNKLLEQRAEKVFKQTKQKKSDIFGFGNRFRSTLTSAQYKNWPDMYEHATIEIEIISKLRNTGLQMMK
ncbi:germination protein, Ger(x)C family [Paenibacillus sp. 1_12]|uniref:Ger(x)C family spore germination protein n=1 Tax=Paenibacillus sp. 1_12 TaxID=1566278 RepID=UPI0008E91FBE|nr:Ger(x)C family spore germination protein [Paenibacillus sp. 1_12]SFL22356.1 germination protein, Ger(x)C family [Paenibacillus sp. 1_12]